MKVFYVLIMTLYSTLALHASWHECITQLMVQKQFLKKREQSLLIQFQTIAHCDYDHPNSDIVLLETKDPKIEQIALKIENTRLKLYTVIHDLNKRYIKPPKTPYPSLQTPRLPVLGRKKNSKSD